MNRTKVDIKDEKGDSQHLDLSASTPLCKCHSMLHGICQQNHCRMRKRFRMYSSAINSVTYATVLSKKSCCSVVNGNP